MVRGDGRERYRGVCMSGGAVQGWKRGWQRTRFPGGLVCRKLLLGGHGDGGVEDAGREGRCEAGECALERFQGEA